MMETSEWTIDWRHKSFPPSAEGMTASRIAEQRWHVGEDFMTPVAVLTQSALEHNLARMGAYCAEHAVHIAPHGKTTMSPELIARQHEHGAWGVTAATVWQARAMLRFGASRVVIANECVDPVALGGLVDDLRRRPDATVAVFVDSVAGVEAMGAALRRADPAARLPVLVEVGAAGRRAGARDADTAVRVGHAAARAPELELAGVGCFEGVLGAARTADVVEPVRALLNTTRHVANELMAADAFRAESPVILTAGGSMFFDHVVEVFTANRSAYPRPVEVVIRPGCYVTHDHGVYRSSSPLGDAPGMDLRPALHVWARVVSTPEPGLAIIDAGKRDVSSDGAMPVVVARQRDGVYAVAGDVPGLRGVVVDRMNDQHGYLLTPQGDPVRLGDLVVLGVSHPCTTFDKWRAMPVVDDDLRVVDAVRTYF